MKFEDINEVNVEFEWFPQETGSVMEELTYQEIRDLKPDALKISDFGYDDGTENNAVEKYFTENEADFGEQEAVEYFGDDLRMMMTNVFSEVKEKLCGLEVEAHSDLLADYIEDLKQRCEVFSTNLYNRSQSEIYARITQCLGEGGCVIAAVDNGQWEGTEKTELLDGGIRTIEIIGAKDEILFLHDYGTPERNNDHMMMSDFAKLNGILLEVLK